MGQSQGNLLQAHDAGLTATDIEAGRKLFAGDWQFAAAAGTPARLPAMAGLEVAFAGRSNVGKSSLINALTGRKALARTSHTPGRTQELIFFRRGGAPLTLVDMPGYGFAAAPKAKISAWTALARNYLAGRRNLARVYVLVDCRRGLKEADAAIFDQLDETAVSYQVVITKADELPAAELDRCLAHTQAALRKRAAAFPGVVATSARGGAGIAELRAAIARLLAERETR